MKISKKSEKFEKKREENFDENSIENLTNETVVINYIKSNHKLPIITSQNQKQNLWVGFLAKVIFAKLLPEKL
jgi:hypothetical protein